MTAAHRLRVAIAGFGPFPGVPRNPSAEVVRAIVRKQRFRSAGIDLDAVIFPTAYAEAQQQLKALLAHKPDAVVLFGVAAKTKHIRIETVAGNTASTLYPDHARFTPALRKLIADGAPRLKSRAPIAKLRAAARLAGVKAEYSNNAGRYLCNAIFYHALAATSALKPPPLVQFIHVPAVSAQPGLSWLIQACEAVVWLAAREAARSRAVSDRDG
jgi:pyroglutamyl-peptidase